MDLIAIIMAAPYQEQQPEHQPWFHSTILQSNQPTLIDIECPNHQKSEEFELQLILDYLNTGRWYFWTKPHHASIEIEAWVFKFSKVLASDFDQYQPTNPIAVPA